MAAAEEDGEAFPDSCDDGVDVEAGSPRLGDPEPDRVSVLVIVRPTLRYELRGEAGKDLYGDVLGSGGSPKMIS